VPETSKKKEKSETRGKNGQVSGVKLGVQRCPLERKKWTSVNSRIRSIYYPPEKKRRRRRYSPCSPKAKIKEEER